MDFVPGLTVAGRYRLLRMAGSGGMGEVWSAEDQQSRGRVALKRLLPAASKHHEVVARFKREAFLLGRVKSDYVARVIDFVDDESFGLILVMEFIEGPSLAHILEDRTLTVEECVDLSVDLLHALCELHDAKIVHRDLKPGNIIMRPMPGRPRATIVDFGISRLLATDGEEVTGITRANIALGTVEYMAPEQILSSRDVTPVTDLYAVGIILFRAVKGHHAFGDRRGEELARAKLIEDAPPLDTGRTDVVARGLSALVARALKKKPAQRYPSAKEMLDAALELEFEAQRATDLDDTTSDGGTTAVKPSPLAAMQASQASQAAMAAHAAQAQAQAPAMPSPPPASPRASMPSMPDSGPLGGHVVSRPPMPSMSDGLGRPADPRGSFASIPDVRPAPPMDPPTESLGRMGVPRGTVALAVLTSFAVGAAVGLVLAPTSAPAVRAADASQCPTPSASVAVAAEAPPTTLATATAAVASVVPAPSAPATATATATAKPSLTGKLPATAWAAATGTAAPAAPRPPSSATAAPKEKPKEPPPPPPEEPDSFVP